MALLVGTKFYSFQEVKKAVKELEMEQMVTYRIGDSRTLQFYYKDKSPQRNADALKYFYLKYTCLMGGQCRIRSKGLRPNAKSFMQGCKAFVYLNYNPGGFLEVTRRNDEHNHDVSQETFLHLPKVRRRSSTGKLQAQESLCDMAKMESTENNLVENTGNLASLRDLTNFSGSSALEHSALSSLCTNFLPENLPTIGEDNKYEDARKYAEKLAVLACQCASDINKKRMRFLKEVISLWENGNEAELGNDPSDLLNTELRECEDSSNNLDPHNQTTECSKKTTAVTQLGGQQYNISNFIVQTPITLITPLPIVDKVRPDSSEPKAIELPDTAKRAKYTATPFSKKLPAEKDEVCLRWVVKEEYIERGVNGEILNEAHLKTTFCNAVLDEHARLDRLKKFFAKDSWYDLKQQLRLFKQKGWVCNICQLNLQENDEVVGSISCDSCMQWLHMNCAGLKKTPKSKYWFCSNCSS